MRFRRLNSCGVAFYAFSPHFGYVLVSWVWPPAVWFLSGDRGLDVYTRSNGGIAYIVRNFALVRVQSDVAGTTAEGFHAAGGWNGSLWSLPFEFSCYLIIAMLGVPAWLRRTKLPIFLAAAAILAANAAQQFGLIDADGYVVKRSLAFGLFFFGGAVLWALSDWIPSGWVFASTSAISLVICAYMGVTSPRWCALPLAYLCIWLGIRLPLDKIGAENDVSYGVYLYAFPIQQLLVFAGLTWGGPLFFTFVAAALSIGIAYISCRLIEQPAMRLSFWNPSQPWRSRLFNHEEERAGHDDVLTRS